MELVLACQSKWRKVFTLLVYIEESIFYFADEKRWMCNGRKSVNFFKWLIPFLQTLLEYLEEEHQDKKRSPYSTRDWKLVNKKVHITHIQIATLMYLMYVNVIRVWELHIPLLKNLDKVENKEKNSSKWK